MSNQTNSEPQPSQVMGNIKQYAGMAEETIGNAIGSQEWTDAGKALQQDGVKEINEAKHAAEQAAPSKTNANVNSAVGGAKEEVGNLVGHKGMTNSGAEQRQAGHTEYEAAKAGEYLEGAGDAVRGKVEGTVGKVVGDDQTQARAKQLEQEGKQAMDLNQPK